MLHAIGLFGMDTLTDGEKIDGAKKGAWFSVGKVTMAGILAGSFAVLAGFWFAEITRLPLAVIGGGSSSCRCSSSSPGLSALP